MNNSSAEQRANKSTKDDLETTLASQQQNDDYQPVSIAYNQALSEKLSSKTLNSHHEPLNRISEKMVSTIEFKPAQFWYSWPQTARLILFKPSTFFAQLPQDRFIQPAIIFSILTQILSNALFGYVISTFRYMLLGFYPGIVNIGARNPGYPNDWQNLSISFLFPDAFREPPIYTAVNPANPMFGRPAVMFLTNASFDLPNPFPILLFPLFRKDLNLLQWEGFMLVSFPLLNNFLFPLTMMLVFAWFYNWWSRRLGGQGTYRDTLKGYLYETYPATLLFIIPFVGWLGVVLALYPLISMLKNTQKLPTIVALVVIVLTLVSSYILLNGLFLLYLDIFH